MMFLAWWLSHFDQYFLCASPSQGFVMNLQPSEAEAGLDIRVPPNVDTEALERRIAEEWAPSSRNMTFEVNITSKSHILLHKLFFALL